MSSNTEYVIGTWAVSSGGISRKSPYVKKNSCNLKFKTHEEARKSDNKLKLAGCT